MSFIDQASAPVAKPREQSRARYPDRTGYIERDGVRVFYEVYGDGEPAILFLPTWTFAHSRIWKMQIPYFARHNRVLVFDPRGNGNSDRPATAEAYADSEFAQDALDVMDATDTAQAVLVAASRGAQRALLLATEQPGRVLAAAFIASQFPASPLGGLFQRMTLNQWTRPLILKPPLVTRGWGKWNAVHWRRDYHDFVQWFARRCGSQPHSTKVIEDMTSWALETDPESLTLSALADFAAPVSRRGQLALARGVRCPVVVIHGTHDRIIAHANGRTLAKATGGRLVPIQGGDHVPEARRPVEVNLAIRELVDPSFRRETGVRRSNARRSALYVSSPIGLGHARRDIAIARELRTLVPGLQIDWLAQHPVTRVLEAEGEQVHPASAQLASESGHWESESSEHDLHCFQAYRRMDEILAANFMVFHDLVSEEKYDLWIGDEAWELDYYLHENPNEKRAPFVWLTDFVGILPMPDGGESEASLAADYNAEMIEHVRDHPEIRDRAIFIGDADDIVANRLGPGLPLVRDWTESNFDFAGYITGFDNRVLGDHERLRAELGYAPDERVCVVTVGGSGVGAHLLRRVIAAYPQAKELVPKLRMIVVAGPRIDPASLPRAEGLEIHAYVHDLYRHLAACDTAVIQGGLTTAMELTAAKRPFLYFPLGHHFEQCFHVAHRLDRYGAGRRMDFDAATPDVIARAIAEEIEREVAYLPVDNDGARAAAKRIAQLL